MSPEYLWNANSTPGSKVVTETIGVSSFLDVVELLKDGVIKLVQHAFPVSVLICLGKETIRQFNETIEDGDIYANRFREIESLYLYCNFFSALQPSSINLAKRC